MLPEYKILEPSLEILPEIQQIIGQKTKPQGALGQLESLAQQIAWLQQSTTPQLKNPHLLVFAGDHGIAEEGVSAYPPEVTAQMLRNFAEGGAAANVLARTNGLALKVVDAGVRGELPFHQHVLHRKIGRGTRNFRQEAAMTSQELARCLEQGACLVAHLAESGCNVVGFGEMGIGNTSSAALLMHQLLELPLEACVGPGTGLDQKGLERKLAILQEAAQKHSCPSDPEAVMQYFGGFELAMMAGAMLAAAERGLIVLVDGFIATAAFLWGTRVAPQLRHYGVFCHQSQENGHRLMLEYLEATPLLTLDLRLGEGTGCALAYPLLRSAVAFFNEMASFSQAGVSQGSPAPTPKP